MAAFLNTKWNSNLGQQIARWHPGPGGPEHVLPDTGALVIRIQAVSPDHKVMQCVWPCTRYSTTHEAGYIMHMAEDVYRSYTTCRCTTSLEQCFKTGQVQGAVPAGGILKAPNSALPVVHCRS